jgi:hypothetical protein
MTVQAVSDIEKNDPSYLSDLRIVLLEENWNIDMAKTPSDNKVMLFRKNGTDYDCIVVKKMEHDKHYNVTIPLPSTSGAYRTRIETAMDVYLYVTSFIEYYAETTLRSNNLLP